MVSLIKRIDLFGHSIGVNYRGEGTYRTKLGGLVSVLTFLLICANTIKLFVGYIDNSE